MFGRLPALSLLCSLAAVVALSGCAAEKGPSDAGSLDAGVVDAGAGCTDRSSWPGIPQAADVVHKKGPYLMYTDGDSIIVRWETETETASVVEYGESETLGLRATGEAATIHQVTLTGLKAGKKYFYRAGDDATMSGVLTASTAPGPDTPFRFAAFGDSQDNPEVVAKNFANVAKSGASLIVHTGDMVGAGYNYDDWERTLFGPGRAVMHRIPLFSAMGNHDNKSPSWWYEFLAYPFPPGDPLHMRYYSYTWGDAFFVNMEGDSYTGIADDPQGVFVKQAFSTLAARRAKYRILAVHQPAWSEYWGGCDFDGDPRIRDNLVPILEEKGVSLVLNGHTHYYQRASVLHGKYDPVNGIKHVITGGGGGGIEEEKCTSFDFVEAYALKWHITVAEVGCSSMKVRAIDIDGNELDSFEIPARKLAE
jgi:hypothetical protein